jgi:alkanesulfonate monooxygenase SsuD/methylene tetrahydromethanopterin reductase-like flavin-dependent oxidoreductase (luciferase family)
MDFGLGLMGYQGCWDDAAYAEQHGFATAGFVDSPLLGGDPFVCLGLAAQATRTMRLGTFLAIPSNRIAPTTASAIATVNRLAPGRAFLGIGTGYTGRNTFGLPPVSVSRFRDFALECRQLLEGEEVVHVAGKAERPIRFAHSPAESYVGMEPRVPVYMAADGPKALAATGEVADGWITTMQYSSMMANSPEVFAGSRETVAASAAGAGRDFGEGYTILSAAICVLEEGESAVSPRALERIGPCAMMAFHSYSDKPEIAEFLPPPIQERLGVYRDKVMARFDGPEDRVYQQAHCGHLSHLLPGEDEVLTEEIVRMTTLTGTASEIAEKLRELEEAGLRNVSFWIPPHLTRTVVDEVERDVMPLLREEANRV